MRDKNTYTPKIMDMTKNLNCSGNYSPSRGTFRRHFISRICGAGAPRLQASMLEFGGLQHHAGLVIAYPEFDRAPRIAALQPSSPPAVEMDSFDEAATSTRERSVLENGS